MKSFLTLRRGTDTLVLWRAFELSMDTIDNAGIEPETTAPETAAVKTRLWPDVGAAGHFAVVAVLGPRRLVRWAGWALPILWKLR